MPKPLFFCQIAAELILTIICWYVFSVANYYKFQRNFQQTLITGRSLSFVQQTLITCRSLSQFSILYMLPLYDYTSILLPTSFIFVSVALATLFWTSFALFKLLFMAVCVCIVLFLTQKFGKMKSFLQNFKDFYLFH